MEQSIPMIDQTPPRLIDYHMHTGVTIDSAMKETDACERALSLGIHEIAFTNHIMLNQPDHIMSSQACLVHWERIQACQKRYPDLSIRLGVEMDYYPGREQDIAATLHEYAQLLGRPLDLVLGSIHELNGVFFSNKQHAPELYKDRDPASVYHEYFALATQAVRSRLFDIMAHPDLIKKYTYGLTRPVAFSDYKAAVEPYIDALLECGVGMELNTKGLKLKIKEAYPSNEMLELYLSKARALEVDPILTMGSDAHHVDDIGGFLPEAAAILRGLGVEELTCFNHHIKSTWKL
jgi:histidinol-phosphatase (PHP family)